jgi:hypothetical protein
MALRPHHEPRGQTHTGERPGVSSPTLARLECAPRVSSSGATRPPTSGQEPCLARTHRKETSANVPTQAWPPGARPSLSVRVERPPADGRVLAAVPICDSLADCEYAARPKEVG